MSDDTGLVLRVSRRNASVLVGHTDTRTMKVGNKIKNLTVGDHVTFFEDHGMFYISDVSDRKNILSRTYRKRSKEIAANVDLICIIAAMQPLFNTHFVDRCIMLATLEDIPCLLVVNKDDLGQAETEDELKTYRSLGCQIITTNTIHEGGLDPLRVRLEQTDLEVVVLLGVSGVGKSSIFNQLVPHAEQQVGEVSVKTGQGTQTTSQSVGYLYASNPSNHLLLVDLPGIQHFGVSDVDKSQVRLGFDEFVEASTHCEYSDCYHLAEPHCGVKSALEAGTISLSRYQSYLSILEEIESAREY